MKTVVIIALLCMGSLVGAESLSLGNGTEYQNVIIISADPVRMLIVHDGGGCQVAYDELVPNSLTAEQRKVVKEKLAEHVERQARIEQLRLEQQAFERTQREKGLILFEGDWMEPQDRQDILASRELDRLEQERLAVELAKQKAELRKAELLAEQERLRLEERRQSRVITRTYYSYPYRQSSKYCNTPGYYSHHYDRHGHSSHRHSSGLNLSFSSGGSSISYRSHSPVHIRDNCQTSAHISLRR